MSQSDANMEMGETERVLAVILNWNLAGLTRRCVESLRASDFADLDIVVVDNGSTDGSAAQLREQLPSIQILELAENRGFARGNNAALRDADSGQEWFLLINNDATVAPGTVSELVRAGRRTRGIVTPLIYEVPSGNLWHGGARERRAFPLAHELGMAELTDVDAVPVDYVTGCVLLVHRTVFEEIGLLDERFFMYYEDLDFSRRARQAGKSLVVATKAVAWHAVGASLRRQRPTRVFLQFQSRTIWCRTNHGWRAAAWWSSLLSATVRTTADCLVRREWTVIAAMWRGVCSGLFSADLHTPRIPNLPRAVANRPTDNPTPRTRQ